MQLNEEFYDNFKWCDRNKLEDEISKLGKIDRQNLLKGYSIDSNKKSKMADEVKKMKKRLSKKDLFTKLKTDNRRKVFELINDLTAEEEYNLFQEYYVDYIRPKKEISNKVKKMNTRTISKMKKALNTYGVGTGKKEYKPYYEVFDGFTKEEVDHIFLHNTEEEKQLLYKKYGRDFSNIQLRPEVSEIDNEIINAKILHTMKRRLKSLRSGITCYVKITDLIDGVDLETLAKRSKKITRAVDYNKLVSYFGENLDKEAYIASIHKNGIISDATRDILLGKEKEKKIHKASYPLIQLLKEARKYNEREDKFLIRIRRITRTLDEEAQKIMYKKYGEYLNEVHDEKEYTNKEKYDIIHNYVPTIKYRLMHEDKMQLKIKPFFDRFPYDSKETVLRGFNKLSENEKSLLILIFGERLDKTISLKESDSNINDKVNSIVKKIKVNILQELKQETGILVMYLKEIQYISNSKEYKEIESKYGSGISAAIICYLYFKDQISDDSLRRLTGLSYDDVKKLLVDDINILRKTTIMK